MPRLCSLLLAGLCAASLDACSSGQGGGSSGGGSAPRIASFTATPPLISPGGSSVLSWSATDVDAAALSPGVGAVTGTTFTVSPETTTIYTLTVSNAHGTDSAQATVVVEPLPSSTWRPRASLSTPRAGHTATLLTSGKVLVAGGADTASAEVYDPATDAWSPTGPMVKVRTGHSAALLASGRVLVVGASEDPITQTIESSAEIYDPTTDGWTSAPPMNALHVWPTATTLASGQVLVLGQQEDWRLSWAPGIAEIYDPASGAFTLTDPIPRDRLGCSATALTSGKVLVAGGNDREELLTYSATLFDAAAPPGTRWAETGRLASNRFVHTATRLMSGNVLVAGGLVGATYYPTASVEIYEVRAGTWVDAGGLSTPRTGHAATLLPSGRVLFVGGTCSPGIEMPCDSDLLATAEYFDPATDTLGVLAPMAQAREHHTATLLPSGRVLVVGGYVDGMVRTATVEEYTP